MKIVLTNVVVGVGVGGVDELLIWQDEKGGRAELFKTWRDWGRIGMTVLGYLGLATNNFAKYAEPVAQSATPLMTKTIIQAIRGIGTEEATTSRTRSRLHKITQTAGPGFENLKTY